MKNNLLLIAGVCAILALSSCEQSNGTGLKTFDPCNCATVKDTANADYKRCKELRTADAQFEAEFQKCLIAQNSNLDPSKVNIQDANNSNATPAADGTYTIETNAPGTSVMWYAEKITGKHHGTLGIKSGNFAMSGATLTGGEIVLDMTQIACTDLEGEEKGDLEGHLKSADFFDVMSNPESKFVITSAQALNKITYDVKGKLTIKGITQDASCQLSVMQNGEGANIGGAFVFDRTKFNVRYGSASFFKDLGDKVIKDEVRVVIDLKAKKG